MKEFFLKENSLEQISLPLMVKKVAVELRGLRSQRPTALESLCAVQPCNLAGFQTNLVFIVQLMCFPGIRSLFCVCAHSCSTAPLEGTELANSYSCLFAAYFCRVSVNATGRSCFPFSLWKPVT